MPRKRESDHDVPSVSGDGGFVEIPFDAKLQWGSPYLSVEDKQWLQDHLDELPELVAWFLSSVESGDVITTKYDQSTKRWLTTIVCKNANHEAGGRALSFRGSSAFNSLVAMAYFVRTQHPRKWWMGIGVAAGGDFG